jgi:uncharacterized DUF497 family protein
MEFRWNDSNVWHVGQHGVSPEEAEWVLRTARQPYPQYRGEGKWLVWGPRPDGRLFQVVYVLDEDGTAYVIHARPLTASEGRSFRRRNR